MEAPLNPRLQQALILAMQDYYLFPLVKNGKTPRFKDDWRKISTRNPETIRNWAIDEETGEETGVNFAIDCYKSEVAVIDEDVWGEKRGDETISNLDDIYGFPPTLEVSTPSDGTHYYYRDPYGIASTQSGLGRDVDTRAMGGYVVAPGSYVIEKKKGYEGPYVIKRKRKLAELPEWVAKKLESKKPKEKAGKGATISEDDPANIDRAIDWLENTAQHAVEGAGGDHLTFATAAKLRDFGCSEEKTLELMLDHWNEDCSPRWDAEDLERKVANAFSYGQKATGSDSAEAEFDIKAPPPKSAIRAKRFEPLPLSLDFNVDALPLRKWLFADLALAKKVSVITAPPGVGKSTLSLMMAISKASGHNILDMSPHERGAAWVYNNEDDLEEMQRRAGAIMQHYGIPITDLYDEDVKGKDQRSLFFMNSGEDERFRIATKKDNSINPDGVEEAIHHIQANNIKLWIVDPLISTHQANENDNGEMEQVVDMYRYIAQVTGCAIILIHHTKKVQDADSTGHEGNMDTLRGASAVAGIARIVATLFGMSTKRAKEYGIQEDKRWRYVGLMMAKANMGVVTSEIRWFEKIGVRIGVTNENMDGEEVGVLGPVALQKIVSQESLREEEAYLMALIMGQPVLTDENGKRFIKRRQLAKPFRKWRLENKQIATAKASSMAMQRTLDSLEIRNKIAEYEYDKIFLHEQSHSLDLELHVESEGIDVE